MDKDDFAQKFERAFVDLVTVRAEQRGFRKGEFAAKMWPWMNPKIAATRWNAMRDKSAHTGKPQNITLADALRMADALGEDLGYLLSVTREGVRKTFQATKGKE